MRLEAIVNVVLACRFQSDANEKLSGLEWLRLSDDQPWSGKVVPIRPDLWPARIVGAEVLPVLPMLTQPLQLWADANVGAYAGAAIVEIEAPSVKAAAEFIKEPTMWFVEQPWIDVQECSFPAPREALRASLLQDLVNHS